MWCAVCEITQPFSLLLVSAPIPSSTYCITLTALNPSLPPSPSFVGVDIGGLFKDFLSDLSARVFDPSYGLFSVTSDNLLYPNPSAILLYPEPGELEALYGFLGEFWHNLIDFSLK